MRSLCFADVEMWVENTQDIVCASHFSSVISVDSFQSIRMSWPKRRDSECKDLQCGAAHIYSEGTY